MMSVFLILGYGVKNFFLVQSALGIDDEMCRLVSTDPLLADFQAIWLRTVRLLRPGRLASGPLGKLHEAQS